MSNGLAIAAMTAVLKSVLEDGLVQSSVLSSMGNILLTTLPPDQVSVGVDGQPQLNLFLYQVSQNRNADWIGRDRNYPTQPGSKVMEDENAPLAINLHYLLTVYGIKDFQAELLLGCVMELMHQTPVLSNDRIRAALNHTASINRTGLLSQALESTSVSVVAEQLDQVQITPNLFDTEQMSRLWSLLQGSYRPSVAYEVSMVMIGEQSSALDASSKSGMLDDPYITKIVALSTTNDSIVAGSSLTLYGRNLGGEITRVRLNQSETFIEPDIVEDHRLLITLPTNLHAGVQQLQVVHQPKFKLQRCREVASNERAFVLHPMMITSYESQDCLSPEKNTEHCPEGSPEQDTEKDSQAESKEESREAILTAQFNPIIGQQQQVIFKLFPTDDQSSEGYSFEASPRDTDVNEIQIVIRNVPAGTYSIQAQVDGAESSTGKNQAKNIIHLT
jgi:hypothetical protein